MPSIIITLILFFILGAIVGSFLNVAGLRWGSKSIISGRSFCFSCRKQLKWWELIPIASFMLLRGRCSSCKSKLSWQYPLVEAWMGAVFASLYYAVAPNSLVESATLALYIIAFSIYAVIFIYDSRHKIIPDELAYVSVPVAIAVGLIGNYGLADWLAGPIIFCAFGAIWLVSRGRAMGLGDAKLGLSIGLLLGASKGASAIVLSFWIATGTVLLYTLCRKIFGLGGKPLLIGGKSLTMKSEIPFGPFLILGAWLSLVLNLDLLYVSSFF